VNQTFPKPTDSISSRTTSCAHWHCREFFDARTSRHHVSWLQSCYGATFTLKFDLFDNSISDDSDDDMFL